MKNYFQVKKKGLLFRDDAQNLAEFIYKKNKRSKGKIIFLDFFYVDFMSRSFIDEFLNVLNELKIKGIEVRIVRLKADFKEFISHVKKTKNKIRDTLALEILR